MSNPQKILAVIPARGGSKGLPGKNIRPLLGKPLLAWTVEAALGCPLLDRVVLSSDDPETIALARSLGCEVPFVRPALLSGDNAPIIEVLWHCWEALGKEHTWLVLLQPTSPLRQTGDIAACLSLCLEGGAPASVSMTPAPKPPHWMVTLDQEGHPHPLLGAEWAQKQRQEIPTAYLPNGAVYVARVSWLAQTGQFITPATRVHIMPPERSIDIDTSLDFHMAEVLLKERQDGPL